MTIEVHRNIDKKGRLVGTTITTSGGEQAEITWDKHGEATLLYGHKDEKKRRVVGVRKFQMGDKDGSGKVSNVVEIDGQEIIRKTSDPMVVDYVAMPDHQNRVDLNAWCPRNTEEETKKLEAVREMKKMAALGALLDLEKDEVKQVISFANYLRNMRENG